MQDVETREVGADAGVDASVAPWRKTPIFASALLRLSCLSLLPLRDVQRLLLDVTMLRDVSRAHDGVEDPQLVTAHDGVRAQLDVLTAPPEWWDAVGTVVTIPCPAAPAVAAVIARQPRGVEFFPDYAALVEAWHANEAMTPADFNRAFVDRACWKWSVHDVDGTLALHGAHTPSDAVRLLKIDAAGPLFARVKLAANTAALCRLPYPPRVVLQAATLACRTRCESVPMVAYICEWVRAKMIAMATAHLSKLLAALVPSLAPRGKTRVAEDDDEPSCCPPQHTGWMLDDAAAAADDDDAETVVAVPEQVGAPEQGSHKERSRRKRRRGARR